MGIVGGSIIIGAVILGCSISSGLDNIAGRIRDLAKEIRELNKGRN